MGRSKHKHKSARETWLSANSRVDRKRDKQDVVHRMVMTSIEIKTIGDVYGHVKKPSMMTFLMCSAKKHDNNGHLLGFVPHVYFCLFDPFSIICTSFRINHYFLVCIFKYRKSSRVNSGLEI